MLWPRNFGFESRPCPFFPWVGLYILTSIKKPTVQNEPSRCGLFSGGFFFYFLFFIFFFYFLFFIFYFLFFIFFIFYFFIFYFLNLIFLFF